MINSISGRLSLRAPPRESLEALAIAINSTGGQLIDPKHNVTALLEHALEPGSCDWFEVIAAGDIVPAKKPAADIYTYALEKMKLPASACLAFEDSENGIRSSQGADLKTLITINDYTKDHDFTGAAIVLSDLGEADKSFTTIAGDNHGFDFVNVEMLKVIHQS